MRLLDQRKQTVLLATVAVFCVICLTIGNIFAQNFDLKHYSTIMDGDYYSGYAIAILLSDEELPKGKLNELETDILSKGKIINKLTKTNFWLCQKALDEWDVKDNEIYMIICANSLYADDCVVVIATIKDGGKSFNWMGSVLSSKDMRQKQPTAKNRRNQH